MRSQREKRDSRCCRKGEEQPAVERRAAQARRRRPGSRAGSRGSIERAIASEAVRSGPVGLPRQLVEAVQSAESMLGRLPSSDEPCWLVAGRELEDPRGASPSLACPPARPRPQARKASFLASMPALTCQKTPRSARDVTEAARLGAARAAGRRRHQARGRRAPPNRQGRRGSREHSTCHTVGLRLSYPVSCARAW